MNSKSKTMLAVFAVIIMVGSALVPFTAGNSSGLAAGQTTDDQENVGSFTDLVNALGTLKEGLSDGIKAKGTIFVPIAAPSDYVEDFSDEGENIDISKETPIKQGETLTLNNAKTYTFTGTGEYVIEEGGRLVLLGIENDWTFKFVSKRDASEYGTPSLLSVKSGALVCVMGVWFKAITAYSSQSLIRCDPGATIIVTDRMSKTYPEKRLISLNVKTGEGYDDSEAVLLDYIHVKDENKGKSKDPPEVRLLGKISKGVQEGRDYLQFSECSFDMLATLGGSDDFFALESHIGCKLSNIGMTVSYSKWDQTGDPKIEFKVENLSLDIESIVYTLKSNTLGIQLLKAQYRMVSSEKKRMTVSAVNMSFVNEAKVTESGDSPMSITCRYAVSADSIKQTGFGNISFDLVSGTYKQNLLLIDIESTTADLSLKFDTLFSKSVNAFQLNELKLDDSLIAEKIRFAGNEFTEVDFTLADLSFVQDEGGITFSTGTSKLISKLTPAGAKSNFDVLVDFSNFASDDEGMIRGNVKADFSTKFDGADRHLKVTFTNLGIQAVTDEVTSMLSCDKVEYTNDVPMNKVYPTVKGAQNFMGSFTIENAEMNGLTLTAKYVKVDFDVLNNGIVDCFGFEINGDFAAHFGLDQYLRITTWNDITGYTKNVGADKKAFTIEADADYGVDVSMVYNEDKTASLQVDYGTANFSNGGLIPAWLEIGEYAKFKGNDVSAFGFKFYCDSANRQGTVMFDLSDGYTMYQRSIHLYDRTITVNRATATEDYGGYAITFDVTGLASGKIKVNDGCLLDSERSEFRGFLGTPAITDNKNAQFSLDTGSDANLFVKCIGDKFRLMVYDVDGKLIDSTIMEYGSTYDLYGIYATGGTYKLIGWNDGSKFISGHDESGIVTATFTMPARNVNINPVYSEVAVVKDNKVVTDAPAVEINASQEGAISEGFVIEVNGATIVMNQGAVDKLKTAIDDTGKVIVNVTEIVDQETKEKKSIVADNALYGIEITDGSGSSISYEQKTEFDVTLTVHFYGDINTFRVSYLDENGHTISVPLTGYKNLGGGTYEVSFKVNHFSEYMVEPVYNAGNNLLFALAIVAVIAVILVAELLMPARSGNKK